MVSQCQHPRRSSRTVAVGFALVVSLTAGLHPTPVAFAQDTHAAYQEALASWEGEVEGERELVDKRERSLTEAERALADAQQAVDAASAAERDAITKRDAAEAALRERDELHDTAKASAEKSAGLFAQAQAELEEIQASVDSATTARDSDANFVRWYAERAAAAQRDFDTTDRNVKAREKQIEEVKASRDAMLERERLGLDYTQEEWERLTGEAIAEMINDYRQAQGLHRLITHELYIDQSRRWSNNMAYDFARTGNAGAALEHSDAEVWGHSGENILYRQINFTPVSQWNRDDWKRIPETLFQDWRDSPGHNQNMLRARYQGVGVGVKVDSKGYVWATTMFFVEDSRKQNSYYPTDSVTRAAKQSGKSFFLPGKAREVMRTPTPREDMSDRRGATVGYGDLLPGVDKSAGKVARLDPEIRRLDYRTPERRSHEREAALRRDIQSLYEDRAKRDRVLKEANGYLAEGRRDLEASQKELDRVLAAKQDAEKKVRRFEQEKDSFERAYAEVPPYAPLADALRNARITANQRADQTAAAKAALDEAKAAVDAAKAELDDARKRLADAERRRPVKPELPKADPLPAVQTTPSPAPAPTESPKSEAPAESESPKSEALSEPEAPSETEAAATDDDTASDAAAVDDAVDDADGSAGGSSVSTVVGIVFALLAAVGALIGIAHQMGIGRA